MGSHVYVGNLARTTNEEALRAAFVQHGRTVKSVVILRNPRNDRSRGFGFVEVENEEMIEAAIATMNGVEVEGNKLAVDRVRESVIRGRSDGRSFQSYGMGGSESRGPRRSGGARRKTR